MNRFVQIACTVSILFLSGTAQGSQDSRAELRILAVGPGNQPLRLTRADIYLDVWGPGKIVPMVRDDSGATMRIDRASLCAAWPEGCPAIFSDSSRIILQAEGYAPVTQTIQFFDGGSSIEIRVPFRRPVERSFRVVDETGAAVSGARLEGQLLFAETNHCGWTEGEPLFQSVTDGSGRVQIPDVDGEISIEFAGVKDATLQKPGRVSGTRLTVIPGDLPSTVAIHRFKRQALQLVFTRNGEPAVGLKLQGYLAPTDAGCGANYGELGETDSRGRIQVDDFYPEEFATLELLDKSGMRVWQGTAPYNPAGGTSRITLP